MAKRESIIHNNVALDIFGFRNVKNDSAVLGMEAQIMEETGRDDRPFMYAYAYVVTYTQDMFFDWASDAPEELTNLEAFWKMVKDGEPASECYLFYIENVANWVHYAWSKAVEKAHVIWKPAEESTPTAEALAKDPN